jgi:hypothetical protein
MTGASSTRTVNPDVKGDAMGARKWAGPLLVGAIILVGCGDDDDSSSEDSPVVTTRTTPTTTAPTASTAQQTEPGDPPSAAVLFEDPFDDDRNGWGVLDDPEYGSAAYAGGDYVWELTGRVAHLVPKVLGDQYDRGELDMADVVVRADATVVAGGGVIGVFCREEPDVDAEAQWYEFVARDGFAAIRRADLESNIEVLAETEDVALPAGQPIAIEATCTNDDAGQAELSLTLNGDPVLTATSDHPLGIGPPGLQAWTFPIHEQMDIRWHDFSIHAVEN